MSTANKYPMGQQGIYNVSKPTKMNLENITLHVEEDKIIDILYDRYEIQDSMTKTKFVIHGVYKDGSSPDMATATAYSNEIANRFCDHCNDILKQEIAKGLTPWDFVVKFYPNYSSCDDIAYNNDLAVLMEGEPDEDSCAMRVWEMLDKNTKKVETEMQLSNAKIYEKAIQAFIEQFPNLVKP